MASAAASSRPSEICAGQSGFSEKARRALAAAAVSASVRGRRSSAHLAAACCVEAISLFIDASLRSLSSSVSMSGFLLASAICSRSVASSAERPEMISGEIATCCCPSALRMNCGEAKAITDFLRPTWVCSERNSVMP